MRQILVSLPIPFTGRSLDLYGYGAMLCLGFLAAIYVARYRARREGQPPDVIYNAALFAFVGGVLGARLFYVIQYRSHFQSWFDLFRIWEGGLVYYGGLMLAAVGVIGHLAATRRNVFFWADIIAPSLALGLAFGRIGCFLNGCCYGDTAHWPWAFAWPVGSIPWHHYAAEHMAAEHVAMVRDGAEYLGATTASVAATWRMPTIHPTQLYSALNAVLLFAVLNLMFRWKRRHGQIMLLFVLLYGLTRLLIEFLRADEAEQFFFGLPTLLGGLGLEAAANALPRWTISQNVGGWMVVASAAALWLLMRSRRPSLMAANVPVDPMAGSAAPSDKRTRNKGRRS